MTRKVEETDIVMAEVEQVTREYSPLAQASSAIFFVLDELHLLHHFYQFSLRFFLDIFDHVLLHNPSLANVIAPAARLAILIRDLFCHVFKRTSRALLHSDHLTLAILLAQVKLRGTEDELDDRELSFLLQGGEGGSSSAAVPAGSSILDDQQQQRLAAFGRLSAFKQVQTSVIDREDEWASFIASANPELSVPGAIWPTDVSRMSSALASLE